MGSAAPVFCSPSAGLALLVSFSSSVAIYRLAKFALVGIGGKAVGLAKTLEEARKNFEGATGTMGSRYQAAVSRADWHTAAASEQSEQNYREGVQRAVSEGTRQKKIQAMSNEDWRRGAVSKGAPIIGQRTSAALGKWQAKFGPIYSQVLTTVGALPPKTLDFRQNIQTRLVSTVEAWKRAAGKL